MGQFLAGADFSTVIGAYLAEEIPVADVLEKAEEHAEWLQRWLKARTHIKPAFGVDEWRGIGKGIYEDRTEKNRQLKEMAYEVEALGFTVSPVDESGNRIDLDSLDTIRGKVDVAHKRRDQLHIELGAARGARSKETIKRDVTKAMKDLDIAEKKLAKARDELTRIEQAKQDAEVEARGLANRESQLRSRHVELESRANRFKDGRCDKCKSELSEKKLKELTGEAVAELSALTAEKAEVEQKLASATRTSKELVAKLNAVRSTFGEAESARAKAAAAVAGLQRERPAERAERVVQEELDAVQVEVAKGETILEQLSRHANHIGLSKRLKEMEAELEHFNWGVKALKDGQVLNELAACDKKDELLARVNHELAPFGYQLDLQPEGKAWAVMFGGHVHDSTLRHSRRLRPLARGSQGEKWIAQFALCLGFSGEGPVLLDNLDHLDGRNKEQVRLRLQRCEGTVILAGAWNLAKEPEIESLAAAFAPARIVWVENGAIASATTEEAA
ncbi:MAG: hypothetical protein IT364_24680 [Candidatus Hydrogenedentes bacterium]|nr:hypothetical protein [Candidatus Hydrogenedentota bacterium]